MTDQEAKERGLPYREPNGFLRNTKLFSQAADYKLRTGRYCPHPIKSKPWVDFWMEEKRRCLEGLQLGTVRVTGYHYFYLNYYPINVVQANENDSGDVARLFPKFWLMDWQFFRILEYCEQNGLHFGGVKARGCGYSEKGASIGARDTNIVSSYTTRENLTVKQFRKTFYFATNDDYLGGDGIVNKCFKAIDYLNEETDGFFKKSFHLANKPAEYKREAGFKKKDGSPVKTGGYVQGTIIDRPDKVRGNRGYKLLFEESGANRFLEKCINLSKPLVELQGSVVGTIIVWGTANEDERGVEGLKKVIMQPQGFRMAKFRNVWEREGQALTIDDLDTIPSDPLDFIIPYGSDEYYQKDTGIGWFVPIYDTLFKDEDGNPLRAKAFEQVMRDRRAILSGQSEEDAMSYFADHPLTVSEALIKSKGKEFNSPKLARQVVNVETGLVDVKPMIGRFFLKKDNEGRVTGADFMQDSTGHWGVYELPSWALKKQNYWEVFLEDSPTRPTKVDKLYISGIDSIDQGTDDGDAKGSSLACVVKKRFPKENALSDPFANTYVAFYKHRPKLPKDSFEEILACLIFFHATALVEYTKKTIVDYIVDQQKLGRFLAHEPSVPGEYNKNYKAKKHKKGVRATNEIIDLYVNFIKEYIEDHAERMYHLPWLKQLVNYVKIKKTVYDYVAAMGMCELLSREYREILPQDRSEQEPQMGLARWHIDPYTGRKKFGVPEPQRNVHT